EVDDARPNTPLLFPLPSTAEFAVPVLLPTMALPLELAVIVPSTVWLVVNVLTAPNCAYKPLVAAVFRLSVTLPLVPPPVKSVPAVTPVIVPVPGEAHPHALPLHCRIWLAAQTFVNDRFSVPLVPPPISPLPAAVLIPVIPLPLPPANTTSNSGGWLVVVVSLLSNVALNEPTATSAMPLFVDGVVNHPCTVDVMGTRMNWFLSAVVIGTFESITLPRAGARL